jgi:hypothetical protein
MASEFDEQFAASRATSDDGSDGKGGDDDRNPRSAAGSRLAGNGTAVGESKPPDESQAETETTESPGV